MHTPPELRFLSLLLLGFLLLCLTAQTTARVLNTRTAQPAASSVQSDTNDADRNVAARRLVSSEKASSINVRELGEYPPDFGIERRSGGVGTAEEDQEEHVPGHEAGQGSEDEAAGHAPEDLSPGHGFRHRVRR